MGMRDREICNRTTDYFCALVIQCSFFWHKSVREPLIFMAQRGQYFGTGSGEILGTGPILPKWLAWGKTVGLWHILLSVCWVTARNSVKLLGHHSVSLYMKHEGFLLFSNLTYTRPRNSIWCKVWPLEYVVSAYGLYTANWLIDLFPRKFKNLK